MRWRTERAAGDPEEIAMRFSMPIVVSLRDCAYLDRLAIDALLRLRETVGVTVTVVLPVRA